MTLPRMVGLLLILGAIGLGVVCLRAEEVRTARRIQQIEVEMIRVRRGLWATQIAIARHRSPQHIRDEIDRWALEVAAPDPSRTEPAGEIRWASTR